MATVAPARARKSSARPSRTLPVHRITVDEYERIADSGALKEPSRVELIDGYMVDKMPKNPGHIFSTTATHEAFVERLPAGWWIRKEDPVRIPEFDEPEPDISIVRGAYADYRRRIPTPADG